MNTAQVLNNYVEDLEGSDAFTIRSKSGYESNFQDDVWKLDNSVSIKWSNVGNVSDNVLKGFKLTIARMAEEVSAKHTQNCWHYFKQYLLDPKLYVGGNISSELILKYKSTLDSENEYKLGTIRSLLRNWIEWKHLGVNSDISDTLDRLVLKGNVKGKAVLHQCPHTGAYTLTEQQSLLIWAGNAFQEKILSLEEFAWFYLIYATARRPSQIRALRICDVTHKVVNNSNIYSINIPRAKQRGGKFRSECRSLTITEDLYLIVVNQIKEVKFFVSSKFPTLDETDIEQLPVFLNRDSLREMIISDYKSVITNTPDYLHLSAISVHYMDRQISRKCDAISERTGDYIHFTPVRCRRTRATNLVRNGITGVQLAYLLDHSDTQQLFVYTQHTGELALRIFDKMNDAMELLSAKFEGRLIHSEDQALRGDDPNSRVFQSSNNQVGNCGGSPACNSGLKACLLCSQFQPLLDAPWEDVLLDLMEEIEHKQAMGASDLILQSFNLQLAHVKAIMNACDKIKLEKVL